VPKTLSLKHVRDVQYLMEFYQPRAERGGFSLVGADEAFVEVTKRANINGDDGVTELGRRCAPGLPPVPHRCLASESRCQTGSDAFAAPPATVVT
jgi:hypothetical protein